MQPESNIPKKIPRREFLANILFAGGAISVVGLDAQYGLVARRDPRTADWDIPEELDGASPPSEMEGWELPDNLMESTPTTIPPPPKPPQPRGGVRPPTIRGKVQMPPPGRSAPPER